MIKDSVFSWACGSRTCFPALSGSGPECRPYTQGTPACICHMLFLFFIDPLLLGREERDSRAHCLELPQIDIPGDLSSLGSQGVALATPQCLIFNNSLHHHNNTLEIKHSGAP